MSKADEIRASARRVRERHEDGASATTVTTAPAVRTKPVRHTVDLSPDEHRRLNEVCSQAADQLGWLRLSNQKILSALVAQLVTDPELQRQVIAEVLRREHQ